MLEDAAHAAGSRLGGRHLGTFGLAGAFSFFSNKNLAGRRGRHGRDRRRRARGAHAAAALARHDDADLGPPPRPRGPATTSSTLGFNYRIDEPRAALARRRLARLDADNARRAELDARYRELLAGVDGLTAALAPGPDARLAHHLFTVVLDEGVDRDALPRGSSPTRGIQTSVHYPPAHRFSIYADGAPTCR